MKCKALCFVCCATLLAASPAEATIPSPLPAITIELNPANPTSSETFQMQLSGLWPDACPPANVNVVAGAGNTLWIDLILRTVFLGCPPIDCGTVSSSWTLLKTSVGPFPAGTYSLYARVVDCNATGQFELLPNQIMISTGAGQPPSKSSQRGQRVVLLENDPVSGLRAGQAGTIICCDTNDCTGNLLVSWDLWTQSKDDTTGCVDLPVPLFPAGSTTWVNPNLLMIGRPFDECGTIRKDPGGCIYFEADDGSSYTVYSTSDLYTQLDTPGGIDLDQRVQLEGLLDLAAPKAGMGRVCPVRDGDIYHPILSSCVTTPQTGCCGGKLLPGDRVVLLGDNPLGPGTAGTADLKAGATGTVVCCQGPYGANWVFVSWDNWTEGINADTLCSSPVIPYVKNSGWWVPCDAVAPIGTGGGYIVQVGSSAIHLENDLTAPNPAQTLIGCTTVTLQSNFRAQLSVQVTATSAADGTWTGTITPDIVDPGTTSVQICVRGENVDLTAIPPGMNQQLASVTVFAVPAP
jgi:hypothetical protein